MILISFYTGTYKNSKSWKTHEFKVHLNILLLKLTNLTCGRKEIKEIEGTKCENYEKKISFNSKTSC